MTDERVAVLAHHAEEVMGTVITIDLFGDGSLEAGDPVALVASAVASLHDADRIFSTWIHDSPMSRLRRGELSLEEVPVEVRQVLEDCAMIRDLTGGWFDPWSLPGGVDPTGYVKGWAAQRALHCLLGPPVTGAIVNAAGDVATFGHPRGDEPFRVGLVDPRDRSRLIALVDLRGAIATSGDYERGAHLVDPFSGRAETRFASASVVGPELAMADALATALVVGGDPVLAILEGVAEFEAFVVTREGERRWTSAFPLAALAADD